MEREPIGVIGAGYVGLVTAAGFAELGHDVWARDIVPEKVEALRRGDVPIHEPGLSELILKNSERQRFTTEMHHRAQPGGYFIPVLAAGMAPWLVPLGHAAVRALRSLTAPRSDADWRRMSEASHATATTR